MRLLLIQPTYSRDPITDRFFQFPLGLLTLASFLRSNEPSISIKIADFELNKRCGYGREQLIEELLQVKWDLIGIASHYDNFSEALVIAEEMKRAFVNVPILLGGVHATVCHRQIIDNYDYVDAVIRGEGEGPLLKIVQNIMADRELTRDVGSCTYRNENGTISISVEDKLLDLSEYPSIDYSFINVDDYVTHKEFSKRVWVESGRGCRFKCRFCSSPVRWRHKVRYFPVKKVMSELHFLRSKGVRNVFFTHDQFLEDKTVASLLCKSLKVFHGDLDWTCYARIDSLSDPIIHMLSGASCGSVFIGFESIVPELQTEVAKRFTKKTAVATIKKCIKSGIKIKGNFIFNLPSATIDTFEEDVAFILELKKLGVDNIQTSYLKLYPGSDFFDKHKWHREVSVRHDQMSYENFRNAKLEDRRVLFAYLFSDEKVSFFDIPSISIREIVGCLVEFFPLTLSYLKNTGYSIWETVRSIYQNNQNFFDMGQYNDYKLWLCILKSLQSALINDVHYNQIHAYEREIGRLSLHHGSSRAEVMMDFDIDHYMETGQIALHNEPKKYVFLKDRDALTIKEEELYE